MEQSCRATLITEHASPCLHGSSIKTPTDEATNTATNTNTTNNTNNNTTNSNNTNTSDDKYNNSNNARIPWACRIGCVEAMQCYPSAITTWKL